MKPLPSRQCAERRLDHQMALFVLASFAATTTAIVVLVG